MGISFKKLLLIPVLGLGFSVLGADNAEATQTGAPASVAVSAQIDPNCSFSSAGALGFGNVTAGTSYTAQGDLVLSCTSAANVYVSLDHGSNGSGAGVGVLRNIVSGSNSMAYQIFQDSGHATVWGDGSGVASQSVSGSSTPTTLTMYATLTVPAAQPAGNYTDTVSATINY
jgi:spore coat protein U-like protein